MAERRESGERAEITLLDRKRELFTFRLLLCNMTLCGGFLWHYTLVSFGTRVIPEVRKVYIPCCIP